MQRIKRVIRALPYLGRWIRDLEGQIASLHHLMAHERAAHVAAITDLRQELDDVQKLRVAESKQAANDHRMALIEIEAEQQERVAAQRGLVPYVRSLEEFDHWLVEHPELRDQLEPILRTLGLWSIKLGYDPDKEVSLSAVAPRRT